MNLAGQARSVTPRNSGYAMVALLVAMSIMAVMMTVAMPVWKQNVQREKEAELIFRGTQYVHAIQLYGRKFANTQPPNLDVLVEQRFLRRKYKDPITGQDFDVVRANQAAPGSATPGGAAGRGTTPGAIGTPSPGVSATPAPGAPGQTAGRGTSPIGTPGAGPVGGITGVASKSKDKSIRLYNGRSHYNEWVFAYQPQQAPGAGAPGAGVPGQRGGQGQQPGGVGGPGPIGGQRGRGDGRGAPGRGGPGGFGFPGGPGFPGGQQGPLFPVTPTPTTPPPGRGRG